MGFTVYYRSTHPVRPDEVEAIRRAARTLSRGRNWLGSEPVYFFDSEFVKDGHLLGGSKPNFMTNPDDGQQSTGIGNMVEVLCQLSRDYHIDWELSHDHDPAIGFIRGGVCDESVAEKVQAIADLTARQLRDLGLE